MFEEHASHGDSYHTQKHHAYTEWLQIPDEDCPPNYYQLLGLDYYQLLGLELYESDRKVIHAAAQKRITHLKTLCEGKPNKLMVDVVQELKQAKQTLSSPDEKSSYDDNLRSLLSVSDLKPKTPPSFTEATTAQPSVATTPQTVAPRRRKRSVLPIVIGALMGPVTVFGLYWLFGGFGSSDSPPKTNNDQRVAENASPQGSLSKTEAQPSNRSSATSKKKTSAGNTEIQPNPNLPAKPLEPKPGPVVPPDEIPLLELPQITSLEELEEITPIEIPADRRVGCRVGPLKEGMFLLVQYVDGTWSKKAGAVKESPDADQISPDGSRLVVTALDGGISSEQTTLLPKTRTTPFIARVETGIIEWQLGIEDLPEQLSDNSGRVRYRVAQMLPTKSAVPQSADPQKRHSVPNLADQRPAKAEIRNRFLADYRAASTPAKTLALAKKLINASRSEEDPAMRYALLDVSRALALESGGLDLALDVIQEIAQAYEVEEVQERAKAVREVADLVKTAKDANKLTSYYQDAIAALLQQQQLDDALMMANHFGKLGQRVRDPEVRTIASELRSDVQKKMDTQTHAIKMKRLAKKEAKTPQDHVLLGKYLVFTEGDLNQALPHFNQGDDKELKALAELDLAKPKEPKAQVAIANAWKGYASALPDSPGKSAVLRRSADWYLRAESQLKEGDRAGITEQLRQLGEIDDLMKLIDPAVVVKHGNWKLTNGVLTAPVGAWSRIQAHYIPAEEYHVTIETKWLSQSPEMVDGRNAVLIGLSHSGRQFLVAVDWETHEASHPFATGFIELDEKLSWSPPTPYCHRSPAVLKRGQNNLIDVFVRTSGVTIQVNGTQLVTYDQKYERLQMGDRLTGLDQRKLFLGVHHASYEFTRFEVRRIVPKLE